jgi:hypothetical protein
MAIEREPADPLPSDFVPDGHVAVHRVSDGENWASVADHYDVEVADLIFFNFHTRDTDEINWYLRRNVGCDTSIDGDVNWAFSSSAEPGLIYIPPAEVISFDEEVITPRSDSASRLKFIVPETGHEFAGEFMETFPVALSLEEAVIDIVELVSEGELIGQLGVAFPVASAVIGTWFGLGAGYAGARADIAKDRMARGFSQGVMLGSDGRQGNADLLKQRFWMWSPAKDAADAEAGTIAQNAYNTGLAAGFIQGRELSKEQREWLWRDIGRRMGDDLSWRGETDTWGEAQWVEWYSDTAAQFRKAHLK